LQRVYVTGIKGMLGKAIVPVFRERYEVYPTDLEEVDICQPDLIMEDIGRCNPGFVLHLAAMTDVDRCEEEPDKAYLTNALGTRNVALACQRANAIMVYINTGSVYDGRKPTPYTEYDTPDPGNVYGRSKYAGELIVKELLSSYYIFYTCWMFGGGPLDKKFVPKIIDLAGRQKQLRVVNDKTGSPTYTVDMAKAIFRFIESGLFGKYHCVNRGSATRFEVAEAILEAAGIVNCELMPVSSDEFDLPAPRPANESMRNYNFELLGLDMMRDWRSALEEYIKATFHPKRG
jgi:dTDP-4-dehydrorhamnose reductase